MTRLFTSLRNDSDGSVAVEFAIVGPILITMLMGVLQIGIGMQNYNALRGISADVARYTVVNYQTNNRLEPSQLQSYATGLAVRPPYGLRRANFETNITTATTQRVSGATEYTLSMTYRVPTFLTLVGLGEIPLTYDRPIFVVPASSSGSSGSDSSGSGSDSSGSGSSGSEVSG